MAAPKRVRLMMTAHSAGGKGMKDLLSICYMVKDGGKEFAQSLESVRGFDAQVCVLIDNSTTDNTAEIARQSGAEVAFHDWPDDFAEARNRSLEPATGKWVFILDHDDIFEVADIKTLLEVLEEEEEYIAIRLTTLNAAGGATEAQFTPRIFRRGSVVYKGEKHHEAVIVGRARFAPGRIYHSGYDLSPIKRKAKNDRDIALMEKQLERDPYNTYYRRNMIRSLRSKGDMEALLEHAAEVNHQVDNLTADISNLSMQLIMIDVGAAHMTNGDYDKSETAFLQLTKVFPANPDGWFYLGRIFYMQEKYAEAAEALNRYVKALYALRTSMDPPTVIVETWTSTAAAYKLMADSYLESGQLDKFSQAWLAGHMQTQQDEASTMFNKLLNKIKQLESENEELRNPKPQIVLA